MEIGRVCLKIAGRDAALQCVIVDVLDNGYVTIDGQTRRKKCNLKHLEPLNKILKLRKGASHDSVVKAFKEELNLEIKIKKNKEKKQERPRKKRKTKAKPQEPKADS